MSYEYILFDLDGTVTDPAIGITNSAMFALRKYGIETENRQELYKFIGPPLLDSFENYYGFSKEEANRAVDYYRDYYRDKGIFENRVYDGFEALLKTLKDRHKTIVLATSKPEVFARQILEHFDLAKYFTYIAGSNLDGTRAVKADVIRYALESCGITELSKAVMVGDRKYDILGARAVGIASIGVLFGYGSREELEGAGADFIAEAVAELETLLPA